MSLEIDPMKAGPRRIFVRRWLPFVLLALLQTTPSLARDSRGDHPQAPDFKLAARAGTVSLSDLRGKVVFVDFWASWCMPCRQSFPWMSTMHDRYAAQGLVIVSISLDKNRDAADAFLERFPAPFTVAFDPSGKTAEAFRVEAMPTSFIVGRDGRIVRSHAGFQLPEAQTIESQIREALSQ